MKNGSHEIQHHHFLLRMETTTCPGVEDKGMARHLIASIIRDIHMKILARPQVYYVVHPLYNEGLTGIAPIQTSHIAFHFWSRPVQKALNNPASKCLLQLDIYTCGSLSLENIQKIMHHLTHFGPTHVNATLLNRNYGLTVERKLLWDKDSSDSGKTWQEWLEQIPGN